MADASRDREVVITGVGLVSPLGENPQQVYEALLRRESAVRRVADTPELTLPTRFAAAAWGFSGHINDFGDVGSKKKSIRKGLKLMCRETQMAVAAAEFALHSAGATGDAYDPTRVGVVFGSDYMLTMPQDFADAVAKCRADQEFAFNTWGETGLGQMSPLWLLRYLPNMPASHVAIFNDFRGPNNSLTQREAAGLLSISEAYRTIRRGHADMMVAGGTGTRIHPMKAIHALQQEEVCEADVPPEEASRPFDVGRQGMVCGEGAGVLVLEEREAALRRGANIWGLLAGAGARTVAGKALSANRRQALAGAAQDALSDAKLAAAELGHVSAHGHGGRQADADEAAALADVLGSSRVPVVASKACHGNLGCGSAVVELIAGLVALREGKLFPTRNFTAADDGVKLSIAAEDGTPAGNSLLKQAVTPQG